MGRFSGRNFFIQSLSLAFVLIMPAAVTSCIDQGGEVERVKKHHEHPSAGKPQGANSSANNPNCIPTTPSNSRSLTDDDHIHDPTPVPSIRPVSTPGSSPRPATSPGGVGSGQTNQINCQPTVQPSTKPGQNSGSDDHDHDR